MEQSTANTLFEGVTIGFIVLFAAIVVSASIIAYRYFKRKKS
ncbi:hypothetical protein [Effusibacillus consociatus]|uniref:LPXTG cell wall anchor domain-containing protein n=1 Tax=Effusibacillus consociatus TaxID=1117041 RepID=A0ABV9Q4J9_9BACL